MASRSTKSEPEKEKREKVSLYLPPALALELRIEALKQRRKLSVVGEEFIRQGLAACSKSRGEK